MRRHFSPVKARRQCGEQEHAQYCSNHDVTSGWSSRHPETVSILSSLLLRRKRETGKLKQQQQQQQKDGKSLTLTLILSATSLPNFVLFFLLIFPFHVLVTFRLTEYVNTRGQRNFLGAFWTFEEFNPRKIHVHLKNWSRISTNRPFPHYAPVSKHKEKWGRLVDNLIQITVFCPPEPVELVPLFTGYTGKVYSFVATVIVAVATASHPSRIVRAS